MWDIGKWDNRAGLREKLECLKLGEWDFEKEEVIKIYKFQLKLKNDLDFLGDFSKFLSLVSMSLIYSL